MTNPRRRQITLGRALVIVVIAAVVAYAVVQTISIMRRNERTAEAERARWLNLMKGDEWASKKKIRHLHLDPKTARTPKEIE